MKQVLQDDEKGKIVRTIAGTGWWNAGDIRCLQYVRLDSRHGSQGSWLCEGYMLTHARILPIYINSIKIVFHDEIGYAGGHSQSVRCRNPLAEYHVSTRISGEVPASKRQDPFWSTERRKFLKLEIC